MAGYLRSTLPVILETTKESKTEPTACKKQEGLAIQHQIYMCGIEWVHQYENAVACSLNVAVRTLIMSRERSPSHKIRTIARESRDAMRFRADQV